MLENYLGLLAISCVGLQLLLLLAYYGFEKARPYFEPIYLFWHPLLYLVVLEPGLSPQVPWFRVLLAIVFATYWSMRLFGSLLPFPRKPILWTTLAACLAALVRSAFSTALDLPVCVALIFGGFALFAIPLHRLWRELHEERLPLLDSRAAISLSLMLAVFSSTNLVRRPMPDPTEIEGAADERGVSEAKLAEMARDARPTLLHEALERIAAEEMESAPRSFFLVGTFAESVPLGPMQISAREAMLAMRRAGMPWSKEYRNTPHNLPRDLPPPSLEVPKAQLPALLLDERQSLRYAALVLQAR